MIRTVGIAECGPAITAGEQPTMIYQRERDRPADGGRGFSAAQVGFGDVWYVATRSVDVEYETAGYKEFEPAELSKVHHEDFVRIPLFRYTTLGRDLRQLYGFAAQIGAAAYAALPRVREVLQMHLALGDVFVDEGKLEFYVGVAFRCLPERE